MTKIEFTIKNDQKGFYGCFSKTGKNSAEILSNIRMKDSLLNPKKSSHNNKNAMINFLKRNGYHNIYGDNQNIDILVDNELNDSVIEDMEEEIDIFKKFKVRNKKNRNKNDKNIENKNKRRDIKKKYFHRLNAELYKYHDLHLNKQKNKIIEIDIADCAKYEPNKDYVMKRIIGSPEWKTRKGRTPLYKVNNSKIYLNHEHPLKNIVKVFIDMNKQTMRGNFNNNNDVRNITTKSFIKNKFKKKSKKINKNNMRTTRSDYLSLDKAKTNLFIDYEKNCQKSFKKRIPSAGTSIATRPQTGMQNNLTSLVQSNSKIINNTSNSLIGNRNITSISSNINKLFNEDNSSMESLTESNDSYNVYKYVYKKQIKSYNKNNEKMKNIKRFNIFRKGNKTKEKKERPKSSNIKRKLNIKGPDFNKTMTREQYYNLLDRGLVIPFSLPNFKLVRERPLTMVVYERPVYKKYTRKEIKGITPDMYNDIYKHLDYINNHIRCNSPDFSKMNINYKKNDKNPLPIYMRGVTSRGACENINEKNLKMNNFAEGKFISNYTSFWPKKSFNKMVNLNLLNSKAFLEHVLKKEGIDHFLKKSLKFYRNNYKLLLKEGLLNKFDNVTYKTIKPVFNPELDIEKYIHKIKL